LKLRWQCSGCVDHWYTHALLDGAHCPLPTAPPLAQNVRDAISVLFPQRGIEVLPQPVADFTKDLPRLDEPGGLRLLTPTFQAAIADLTARMSTQAPLKCATATSGAQVVLTCQAYAAYAPTVVDMVNTSKVVQVQDLFTATMGNMCEKALAGAQGTFDGHAATIREGLPIEEPALRNALASARDDAARAMEGLPVDGGFRPDTLARLDAYVASVAEHVTLDNATASTNQCRGVWAEQVRQLEAQLGAFKSVEELNAAVAAKRLEMRSAMVGPYRDSKEMADEMSSWVLSALTSLGHRLGMEQATLDAE
jgi:hypothetical protein